MGFVKRMLLAVSLLFCFQAAHATLPIQHWDTPSGSRVYFVETHDLPMLDVSVDFRAGSAYDTPAKSGLASLTRHMLSLGARDLSEDDISRRLADIGAEMGGSFDQDRAGLSLRTLVSERNLALDIFGRVLQSPVFDEKIIEREKQRIISEIKDAETRPDYLLSKNFSKLLYGDHPYGLNPIGEVDSISSITRQDLVDFYTRHYRANGAVIAMVGDVSRAEAEKIALQLSANLAPGDAPAAPAEVHAPAKAATDTIDNPSSQSHIALGYVGVKRQDPDYFPLYVGNYILGGGGFVSRLLNEVREKRGLAYSTYSYFFPLEQLGPFQVGLQTKREQTSEALGIVRSVIADFVANGPTEKELVAAKQNIVGGFALRIDSNRKIHEYLGMIGFYQLPLSYLDDFPKQVEKVTVGEIKDAFARRIDPARMVTVVVGAGGAR